MLYYQSTPPVGAEDLLGASIKSAGLSRYEEMREGFKTLTQTIQSMDAEAAKFAKTMGRTSENSLGLKQNLNASYGEIVGLGGKMSDAVDMQEGLFKASGRNLILLKSQAA
jgi:predicted transcriptional regulator